MNINFDKTDRLINLIDESCFTLELFLQKKEKSLRSRQKDLYESIIKITASSKSKKQKNLERVKAFAKAYGCEGDLVKGEACLKLEFDEDIFLKSLTRAYWQIQTLIIVNDNTGNNFADKEGLQKLIEKAFPDEPYKEVIADVISRQEPRLKDIEKEFWNNCTDTDKINNFCNIYREHWRTHLKEVDEKYYNKDSVLFDPENELYRYFKDLRKCGLLQQKELYAECRLGNIARQINSICECVIELFKKLRASTISTIKIDKVNGLLEGDSMKGNSLDIQNSYKIPWVYDLINGNCNIPIVIIDFLSSFRTYYKGDPTKPQTPFISIHGSYMLRKDWEWMQCKLKDDSKYKFYQKDVDEYLPKYADGFKNGYKNFENEIIKPKTTLFNSEENTRQIIFDQVTGDLWSLGGISERCGGDQHKFSSWYDDGKKMGYFYRALFLIVENYKLFIPLFEERLNKRKAEDENMVEESSLKSTIGSNTKGQSAEENIKFIEIDEGYIEVLKTNFISYVIEAHKEKAIKLLKGDKIDTPVHFKAAAIKAVACFTTGYHTGKIKIDDLELCKFKS